MRLSTDHSRSAVDSFVHHHYWSSSVVTGEREEKEEEEEEEEIRTRGWRGDTDIGKGGGGH